MSSDFQNRLRRNLEQPTPADHPSADVLTAYAEHTLSAREEQEVVQHLSVCAECREVVYLASEAEEEPAVAVASLPEPRRFRWWTWALPLTAVLVVGSVVLVEGPLSMKKNAPQQLAQAKRQAELPPAPSSATNELAAKAHPEPQAAPAVPKPLRQKPLESPAIATKRTDELAKTDAYAYRSEPSLSAGLVSNAPVDASAPAPPPAEAKAKEQSAAAPAGASTVEVTAQAESPGKDAAPARSATQQLVLRDQGTRTDADKKAAAHAFGLARAANVTRHDWIVTAQGHVQHLVNGTYIDVPLDPAAYFNVIAASGVNVWVAGKNLALYHSADDGLTWLPQSLPAQRSADIIRLQATDALNLSLTTSTGQNFISHDGGKTWLPLDPQKPR